MDAALALPLVLGRLKVDDALPTRTLVKGAVLIEPAKDAMVVDVVPKGAGRGDDKALATAP
jgi:hypothetical protein